MSDVVSGSSKSGGSRKSEKGKRSTKSITDAIPTPTQEHSQSHSRLSDGSLLDFSDEMEILGEFDTQEVIRSMTIVSPPDPIFEARRIENEKRLEKSLKRIMLKSKTNIWETCCAEVRDEIDDINAILTMLGLPPYNYSKDKVFPITDYVQAPNLKKCNSKDYLDFYVFPYLLPAIQFLIQFAQKHRIFQCRRCTFNPSDFISEYLYNSNPRFPSRQKEPVALFEAPFAKKWLKRYPRPATPKWLKMSAEGAIRIIQRAYRGYLVRRRPDIQEMRKFWRDLKHESEMKACGDPPSEGGNDSDYVTDEEFDMMEKQSEPKPVFKTHSQECEICAKFKELLVRQSRQHKKEQRAAHAVLSAGPNALKKEDESEKLEKPENPESALRNSGVSGENLGSATSTLSVPGMQGVASKLKNAMKVGDKFKRKKLWKLATRGTVIEFDGEQTDSATAQRQKDKKEVWSEADMTPPPRTEEDEKYRYKFSPHFKSKYEKCCFQGKVDGPLQIVSGVDANYQKLSFNLTRLCDATCDHSKQAPAPALGSTAAAAELLANEEDTCCTLRDPASCNKFVEQEQEPAPKARVSTGVKTLGSSDSDSQEEGGSQIEARVASSVVKQ